jgi:hypothetical protein
MVTWIGIRLRRSMAESIDEGLTGQGVQGKDIKKGRAIADSAEGGVRWFGR